MVPLAQAANAKHVKVRFHYSGSGLSIWQLDTVTVGSCAAVSGGIVAGKVVDGNTGDAITPATVTDTADSYATATTVATPDDLALADGYYWLFSAPAGRHTYRTVAARYTTSTGTLTTRPDKINRFDRTLKAGRLAVSSNALSVSETLGGSGSKKVTFTNRGRRRCTSTSVSRAPVTPHRTAPPRPHRTPRQAPRRCASRATTHPDR